MIEFRTPTLGRFNPVSSAWVTNGRIRGLACRPEPEPVQNRSRPFLRLGVHVNARINAPLYSTRRRRPVYSGIVWRRSQSLAAIFRVHAGGGIGWSRFPVFIPREFSIRTTPRFRRYICGITAERYITRVSLVYRLHRAWAPLDHCLDIYRVSPLSYNRHVLRTSETSRVVFPHFHLVA